MHIKESPLFWPAKFKGRTLFVLDETLIPEKVKYLPVRNVREAVKVIREMRTRAFGQLLVVLNTFLLELRRATRSDAEVLALVQKTASMLNASRPTFPFSEVTGMVVFWARQAIEARQDVATVIERNIQGYLNGIRLRRLDRVRKIADLIKDGDSILTHCNVSGELAMAAFLCRRQGKKVQFFASETRPYLQGAKLTAWELRQSGAQVILIGDIAVGSILADGFVNKVVVGSDRSCANGDFANKIGTYQLAVLAREFGIPFYVLTQPSIRIKRGEDIPIEIRDEKELLCFNGQRLVKGKVRGFYPAFDVVPHELVTGTIPIEVTR
jgi:methylthioribose-1-phosphate isomerase